MNLALARDFLQQGDLVYALELVETEEFDELGFEDQLHYIDIKTQIYSLQNEFEKVLNVVDFLSDKHSQIDPSKFVDIINKKATAFYELSQYTESSDIVDVGLDTLDDNRHKVPHDQFRRHRISLYQRKGKTQTQLGDYENAIIYQKQALDIAQLLEEKDQIAGILNNLGNVYYFQGKLQEARVYYEDSLKIREELGENKELAVSLNNLGVLYSDIGNLDQALSYYMQSMNIYKEYNLHADLADSYNNLGVLYAEKGEVDIALEYYQKSLKLKEELGGRQGIATSLNNIGLIYQMMGNYDLAEDQFLTALAIDEEIKNSIHIADDFYNLVKIYLDIGDKSSAEEYVEKLRFLDAEENTIRINQRYRLANALLLKTSTRRKEKSEAQILFEEIAEEKISDHMITIFAMLNLCELLIDELYLYGDTEILMEIKQLIQKLFTTAKDKNSHSLLGETYLLQAKLALVDTDITKAQQLLTQAQLSCEEKGLQKLAMKASAEHDVLLAELNKWEELMQKQAPLQERLTQAKIADLMQSVIQKKVDLVKIQEEEPILLLILAKNGTSILSRAFSQVEENDQLVGGFLSAINTFMGVLFQEKGSLDRIKYKDYTILLKQQEAILFCYAFKGQSYGAMKNLEQFIGMVTGTQTLWNSIRAEIPQISKNDEMVFERYIKQVFRDNNR
ncbi:MAG: tetratricopeptide repeat protein [Candidatus Kariarchaeaceae archaeon]